MWVYHYLITNNPKHKSPSGERSTYFSHISTKQSLLPASSTEVLPRCKTVFESARDFKYAYLLKVLCPTCSCWAFLYPRICSFPRLTHYSNWDHSLPSCLNHIIWKSSLILLFVSPLTSNPRTSCINSVSRIYLWSSLLPYFTPQLQW